MNRLLTLLAVLPFCLLPTQLTAQQPVRIQVDANQPVRG